LANEKLLLITIKKLNAQRFVGQVYAGHLGYYSAGEQAKRKKERESVDHRKILIGVVFLDEEKPIAVSNFLAFAS
jgi:hypothetical protein